MKISFGTESYPDWITYILEIVVLVQAASLNSLFYLLSH